MPADRVQKSRSPKHVPDLGDPDRKRVLNILAQRRYRQRRREKIAALEAQTKTLGGLVDQASTNSDDTSPQASSSSATSKSPDATQDVSGSQDFVEDIINIPCADESSGFAMPTDPFEMVLVQDFNNFTQLPTPLPSSPELTDIQPTPTFTFPLTPDGGTLTIPLMSMMQAFFSIANLLNITDNLWDPTYLHVMPSLPLPPSLPSNLHPVPAQLLIPHHPALDLVPWPTMREKLICMLSLPSALRPPIAREEEDDDAQWPCLNADTSSPARQSKAVSQLVLDLEDFQDGGGMRVHGNTVAWGQGSEFIEEAWEIGEAFYRKWWFVVDERIVAQSNRRRRERGLGRLRLAA